MKVMSIIGIVLGAALILAGGMFMTQNGGGYLYLISGIFFIVYCSMVLSRKQVK